MATAYIVIQQGLLVTTPGISTDQLVLNVPVVLHNSNDTGVTSWFWQFIDLPSDSNAALATPLQAISGFTPDVTGTYLIKLTINSGLLYSKVGAGIKTANLHYRIPAAMEDDEFDPLRGWAGAVDGALKSLDDGYGKLLASSGGTALPLVANILGATIVEDPSGTRISRRLTQDDIDPSFAISSFSISQGSVELGTTVIDPAFTASYNSSIASATLGDGSDTLSITLPAGLNSFAYNAGSSGLPARSYQKLTINGSVTWTLTAIKLGGAPTKTGTTSINLGLTRRYYNIVARPGSYDETFVKTVIVQNFLGTAPQGSYSFSAAGAGKRIYFAWPTAYGTPTFKDGNGFTFSITKVATGVSFTNTVSPGFSIPGGYDIWESDNELTTDFVVNVT